MALLNDILTWTETLPNWQRDATRRLLLSEEGLSVTDYDELYLLLKSEHGFPKPEGLNAQVLSSAHLPTELAPGELVKLKTLRELKNVNKIPQDQALNFSEHGITVIYGGNGSGKSGYARVMKHACRARDQSEPIHPDANDPEMTTAVPSAIFDIEVGENAEAILWTHNSAPPDKLSTIAVFDSRCARSYLTAEQDVAYLPYGLDIVENLANVVLPELSRRLDDEIASIDIDTTPYEYLRGKTAVGAQIEGLSAKSDTKVITQLGTLSDEIDEARISSSMMFLEWRGNSPGYVNEGLPWDHQGYKARINSLEQAQRQLAKTWPTYPGEEDKTQMRHEYDGLRATLERVIQDVVFNGVVKRYRDWIRVDSLEDVVGFEQSEYEEIDKLHKRCCDVVSAHDPSSAKDASVPTATDLGNDIEALKKLVQAIKERRQQMKEARKW